VIEGETIDTIEEIGKNEDLITEARAKRHRLKNIKRINYYIDYIMCYIINDNQIVLIIFNIKKLHIQKWIVIIKDHCLFCYFLVVVFVLFNQF
jgi:hypothetical protein